MRVTLVSPYDPAPPRPPGREATVGGVERVFAELSKHLARRGHEVTVVASAPEAGQRIQKGVRTVLRRRRFTLLRAPAAGLASEVRQDAELVHVAGTYPFTTVPVLRRARRLSIPAVLDFHFEPSPPNLAGRIGARLFRRRARRHYDEADAVLVRSEAYARSAPSLAGIPARRLRVVPNGVDPARFGPTGPRRQGPYLLAVGRLVPYKGIDILLEALSMVRPKRTLLVVGDGPERARLERRARRLEVDARFLGHVPDAALPSIYRGATLTVLPSINGQEAFGIALVESMACGTPVVASALPGVEEVARTGGLVARPGDPASLAEAIRKALTPGVLLRGARLAERTHRAYSWDAVAQRVERIYIDVLQGARRPIAAPDPKGVTGRAHPGRDPVL